MEISDFIAFYGAIVASILAFKEIRRKSKVLKIVIDYEYLSNTGYLNLINQSERPITIASITMQLGEDRTPSNCMFTIDEKTIIFPKTLAEYSSVQMELADPITSYIINEKAKSFSVKVFDIEGKVFSKFNIRGVDEKWGDINKNVLKR